MIARWATWGPVRWQTPAGMRTLRGCGRFPTETETSKENGSPRSSVTQMRTCQAFIVALLPMTLALSAAALIGCQSGADDVVVTGACTTDEDCAGTRCHEGRFCVQTPTSQSELILRLQPSGSTGLVVEHFKTTIGGPDHEQWRNWNLTPPAAIHGTVSRGLLDESVPGTLIATTPGSLEGTWLSYKATSFDKKKFTVSLPAEGGELEDRSFGFQLRVQPGHSYNVLFWPQIDDIPPFYTQRFVGGASDLWQFDLPVEDQLLQVHGRIVRGQPPSLNCDSTIAPTPCGEACTGVAGLQVRLAAAQGRRRSTRAVTGADGTFVIHANPVGTIVWLKFQPHDVDTTLPYGVLAQPIDLNKVLAKGAIKHDLGDLHLGDLPGPGAMVDFRPKVVEKETNNPVAGARATLRHTIIDAPQVCRGSGSASKPVAAFSELYFERTGLTNAGGHVVITRTTTDDKGGDVITHEKTLQLPAGEATASILPPPLAAGAAWRGPIPIKAAGGKKDSKGGGAEPVNIPLPCEHRPTVRGEVTDFRNLPVVSPTILFKPLLGAMPKCVGEAAEMFPRPEAPIAVQGHDSGQYDAYLDAGRYAVLVEPPQGSGLARALIKVVDVCPPQKTADGGKAQAKVLDLSVPPPSLMVGHVYGPSGGAVAGVVIDVLANGLAKLQPEVNKTPPKSGMKPNIAQLVVDTQVLGSAVTDANGAYEILVAAGQLAQQP